MFKRRLKDRVADSFNDLKKIGFRGRKKAPYKYNDLNPSEVRLLTLLPGRFRSRIYVLFEVKTLTESSLPRYEALSYAWGSSDNPVDIYIGTSDDYVVSVTQNLACALQHLRYTDQPRTLWIDAICVDQANLTERSSQVERMTDIYKLAEMVLVWLGPEGDDSSFALEVLHSLSTKVDVNWIRSDMKPSDEALSKEETHWSDSSAALPYGVEELIPIHRLFDRSWFGRLWIRQEVRLAKCAVVICGFDTIPWQNFRTAVYCLHSKDIAFQHLLGTSQQLFLNRCEIIFHLCTDPSYNTIPNLIDEAQICECSDPRDRIYGILGMFTGNGRALKIIPDYQKSIDQVYQDFFLSYLHTYKYDNLRLLSSCEIWDHPPTMPSWVKDLSKQRISGPFPNPLASGSSAAQVEYTGEGSIRVLGVKVAIIRDAHQIRMHDPYESVVFAAIRQFVPPSVVRNGGELLEKYCRTICGDRFQDLYDPPLSFLCNLDESKEILRIVLGPQESVDLGESQVLAATRLSNLARYFLKNRSFISTEAGHFGLGPLLAKAGYEVVVFPGCPSPMVLRPMDDGRYQVVGECLILGLMDGEGLLGPLPEWYEHIFKLHEDNLSYSAYRDRRTGQVQWTDPRFDFFKSEMQEDGIRKIIIRESESDTGSVNGDCGVQMMTSYLPSEAEEVLVVGVDLKQFELI